ncbi:MAG TPA: GNAT family N-acetyltransferase [Candidatus Jeotgalibaca merdavium]|uniref:GNAT family N-acetyltransferase n=1 Tax=Candidatus Jeotgalibaca merdavium TaxID=2838627 RepID=A0A9D2KVN5_9LACT|nr:GNAT family N-acetyltransferase [Candidatus Jeotgalibaca merdavium]
MFKKAMLNDIPFIMGTINFAKDNLKRMEIDQWQSGYPNESTIKADIEAGHSYLYYENNEVVAVLALLFGEDPLYHVIEEGQWLTNQRYVSIHRVAVVEGHLGKGVMGRVFNLTEQIAQDHDCHSTRVDTHPDNKSMQRALEKADFKYCGHVFMANGDLRYAYEKVFSTN